MHSTEVCLCTCSPPYPACKGMRYIVCGLSGSTMFLTLSHKHHDFWRKVTEYKMYVLILYRTFIRNVFHSYKNSARYCYECENVFCRLFLSDFNETSIFLTYFRKNVQIQNFIQVCPVGAELFHTDGRTDRRDEANCRFSQFRESPS